MNKKQVLDELCKQLKSTDPINFARAQVSELWKGGSASLCDDTKKDKLCFTINDNFNLKLLWERRPKDFLYSDWYYVLGEPNVQNIIAACEIYYKGWRERDAYPRKSIVQLLGEHYKEFNRSESVESVL